MFAMCLVYSENTSTFDTMDNIHRTKVDHTISTV